MASQAPDAGSADPGPNEKADNLLQFLVSAANAGADFPVTVFVSGLMVSGTLIGRKEYLEQFTKDFTRGWSDEHVDVLRDTLGLKEDQTDDEVKPFDTLRYVHLREAKVFSPGQRPLPENGLLWRGRLSEISGFSYGTFQVQADDA